MNRTILAGRFELRQTIARGGQGDVFLAWDNQSGDFAAVKRVQNEDPPGKEYRKRCNHEKEKPRPDPGSFGSEAGILSELRHPGIPAFRSAFQVGQVKYLAMDYIEGETLKEILERRTFSEEEVKNIARNLLTILSYLHRQNPPVIYLDLKPSNIILDQKNEIHLVDFGIARRKETGKAVNKAFSALTRGYAAPEQYLFPARFDERTDLYALGVTLHYLLTGKNPNEPPYEFASVRKYNAAVSPGFTALIEKLLQPSPKDRFQSVREVQQAMTRGPARKTGLRKLPWLLLGAACVFAVILINRPSEKGKREETGAAESESEIPEKETVRDRTGLLSIEPAGGEYTEYLMAKVNFDPKKGKVYYTTDGSEPDKNSAIYLDGIVVSAPVTKIKLLQAGYDGTEKHHEETYYIKKEVEEVELDPSEPGAWELYYRLRKPWGEAVTNYELAQIRSLSRESYLELPEKIRNYLLFYKEDGEDGAYRSIEEGGNS